MWHIIRDLVAGGVTVFLTTQYLEEADQLADRVALLDHGHIIAEGTPTDLKRLVPGGHIRLKFSGLRELDAAARAFDGGRRDDDALTLEVASGRGRRFAARAARPAGRRRDRCRGPVRPYA
jgi:ABC-2 type transport system ATP-binding protein